MKKVMTILTAAAFVLGAAGMVSFTVKESHDESTGWFYVDPENPDVPGDPAPPSGPDCSSPNENVRAKEFLIENGNAPPTRTPPIYGDRL